METKASQRWHIQHDHIAEDQNPGCHTHSSGFDYVAHYGEADKRIDLYWARERLLKLLRRRTI